jgi:hypothetical protein
VERLVKRELIALVAAFVVFPFLFALILGADTPGDLLWGGLVMIVVQFITPLPLWPIPFMAGSIAGLIWHCVAELLRRGGETLVD